jgi:hypothetical protein
MEWLIPMESWSFSTSSGLRRRSRYSSTMTAPPKPNPKITPVREAAPLKNIRKEPIILQNASNEYVNRHADLARNEKNDP